MRTAAATLLALLLAGCGPAGGGEAPRTGGRLLDVPAAVVRVDGERALSLHWTGSPPGHPPCGSTPAVTVDEHVDRVVLAVREQADGEGDGPCPDLAHLWSLPVALAADLGGRAVVGPDGARLRVVRVPEPTRVPEGYAPAPGAPDARTWATASGDLLVLSVVAQDEPASSVLVRTVPVGGAPARVLRAPAELAVRWRAGGQELRLSSSGPDGPLPLGALLRAARSVDG